MSWHTPDDNSSRLPGHQTGEGHRAILSIAQHSRVGQQLEVLGDIRLRASGRGDQLPDVSLSCGYPNLMRCVSEAPQFNLRFEVTETFLLLANDFDRARRNCRHIGE